MAITPTTTKTATATPIKTASATTVSVATIVAKKTQLEKDIASTKARLTALYGAVEGLDQVLKTTVTAVTKPTEVTKPAA